MSPNPKIPRARDLALDILVEARRRGRAVEDLLAAALHRYPALSRPERALLLELVQGVKRWELRLDYVLSHCSDLPLGKLHPLVREILRLAAFQIVLLDRVPDRAAVHEAGKMARVRGLPPSHAGFINAVLRRLAAGDLPPLPDPVTDPVRSLSVEFSHPGWLVRRWLGRYGLEATWARLSANNEIPPLTIRVNTWKTDRDTLRARLAGEGIEARDCRFSPVGLTLEAMSVAPAKTPSYREGWWLFQDEAAQLVSYLLSVSPGQRLAEIGSGRGGKTTHLAELMGNQGLLLAVDSHRGRLQELRTNLGRWEVTVASALRADAAAALPLQKGAMDAVILDVPCSALGILRRHPEIKTRLQEPDLATFPPRQRALLESGAQVLRPGGHLLYITCTTEPEENEELINAFLAANPDFRLATDPNCLPEPARSLVHPPGFFRTSPAEQHLDAFFAAVLARD